MINEHFAALDEIRSENELEDGLSFQEAMLELEAVIQESGHDLIPFQDILEIGARCLKAQAILVTRRGKILQIVNTPEEHLWNGRKLSRDQYLEGREQECLRRIERLKENADMGWEKGEIGQNICIPLFSQHHRQGTLLFLRAAGRPWMADEVLFSRICAMTLARDLSLTLYNQDEAEKQRGEVVRSAIATLSYSEHTAMNHVFRNMDGNEGIVVASRLADQVGVARSVIVNALRKFESAGIIEARSLGVKGTYIRVLNPVLLDEFEKYEHLTL